MNFCFYRSDKHIIHPTQKKKTMIVDDGQEDILKNIKKNPVNATGENIYSRLHPVLKIKNDTRSMG